MNKQKSFKVSRLKGITPVVAIVLLLLVTVGAVGIVYTQFQGIVNQGETDTEFLEETNVKIVSVKRNKTLLGNYTEVVIENTGESEYNLTERIRFEYSVPGESRIRPVKPQGSDADYQIFDSVTVLDSIEPCEDQIPNWESFGPGDINSCLTKVAFPDTTQALINGSQQLTIYLVEKGSDSNAVIDEYTCSPSTSESVTC